VLLQALYGLFFAGRRHLWMTFLLFLSGALMLGHFATFAPWSLLKAHVFPFTQMRVPSRFRCEVTMFLVAFASLGLDDLLSRVRLSSESTTERLRLVVASLALFGAADVVAQAAKLPHGAFNNPPLSDLEPEPRLHLVADGASYMVDQPRRNVGRRRCWDEWGFGAGAPLWLGDVPQARVRTGDAKVHRVNRTQSHFVIDVEVLSREAVLALNTTWDIGWRTNVGTVDATDKLLTMRVPRGTHRAVVSYVPQYWWLGVVLNVLGVLAAGAWLWHERRHGAGFR
jgi:hypothetical protein